MSEIATESAVRTWSAPECPYTIEYSTRVLDDIRLAVVDAFFSLPRGGAEIGGILLGSYSGGKISIQDYQALDCEHAMGPSFTLSPRDQAELARMVAAGDGNGLRVVGWYHSHTRSDIFLSQADQDIHKRFFPEPWQVALILKPHTFDPARCGFFLRGADGAIRGAASYQEFALEPLPMRPVPSGEAPPSPPRPRSLHNETEPAGPVITVTAEVGPESLPPVTREMEPPAAATEKAAPERPVDLRAPKFAQLKPERSWRWLRVALPASAALALCGVGYQTRELWFPTVRAQAKPLVARIRPPLPQEPAPSLALGTADDNGQLRIHWDSKSAVVQKAVAGRLEIADGALRPQSIKLDSAHLLAGALTYGRTGERVDVTLIVDRANGQKVREVASFVGKLPEHKPPPEDPAVRRERDDLRQEAAQLKQDLNLQASRTRKLEKDLNDVRLQLQKEQQRRLSNQVADPGK